MAQSFSDSGMVQLTNPISQRDMAFMRPSNIKLNEPAAIQYQSTKGSNKVFEIGKVFKRKEKIKEGLHLAAVSFGNVFGKQWDLDLKGSTF